MSTDITISKQRSRELGDIARSISEREATIDSLKRQTVDKANQAVTEAILQGQELIKARSMVPHGLWEEWLKVNCPTVSMRNAQRYVSLAKQIATHVSLLNDADSIRSALALIADQRPIDKVQELEERKWPTYLEGIYRASKWLGFIERNPLDKWPDEGKTKLKEDLEPVAKALWPEKFA
jgi:hypothetical protein